MKLLVTRFSSIGDIVLCSPVVRVLANAGNEVHFLTKAQFASLVGSSPYITKVHVLSDDWKGMVTDLKREQFDHIIDLHNNLRTIRLALMIGVSRHPFPKINFQKWLKVHLKKYRLPKVHIVDRYFKAVQFLEVENDQKGLDFFFPDDFQFEVGTYLETKGIKSPYAVWVIGGAHATKCLPLDKIVEFRQKLKFPVIFIGGPDEKKIGESLEKECVLSVNGAGNLSIHESAAVIKASELVLTNDTGMMHIAAAFQKKTIVFWGNTIPEFGMFPYMKKSYFISLENNNISCRPCSKIGFSKCPKKHFNCMNELSVAEFTEGLKRLI